MIKLTRKVVVEETYYLSARSTKIAAQMLRNDDSRPPERRLYQPASWRVVTKGRVAAVEVPEDANV